VLLWVAVAVEVAPWVVVLAAGWVVLLVEAQRLLVEWWCILCPWWCSRIAAVLVTKLTPNS